MKVAAYCRVSTDKEDQCNSLESQKAYFEQYIERHSDWELSEIYADEGISGTSTKKRAAFNRMMNDAYDAEHEKNNSITDHLWMGSISLFTDKKLRRILFQIR